MNRERPGSGGSVVEGEDLVQSWPACVRNAAKKRSLTSHSFLFISKNCVSLGVFLWWSPKPADVGEQPHVLVGQDLW